MNNSWLLILGANSDIAVAAARRFAQAGYNIHLASRKLDELQKEADNLALKYEIEVKTFFFDALDYASHASLYTDLKPQPFGVILTFGLLGDQASAQKDFGLAKAVIDTNYTGAVSILEIIASDFEKRKTGFIVGISSVAGDRGRKSNYIYGSAKAGYSAYLSGLRHRLYNSGVLVLTVKPGFVATKMTSDLDLPERLTAKPWEVADYIFNGVQKRKSTIYFKPVWRLIMLIIIHLPEFIFKRSRL